MNRYSTSFSYKGNNYQASGVYIDERGKWGDGSIQVWRIIQHTNGVSVRYGDSSDQYRITFKKQAIDALNADRVAKEFAA